MKKVEADKMVLTIAKIADIVREIRPELVFEVNNTKWSERDYHIEVMARRSVRNDSTRTIMARELLTRDNGDIETLSRIKNMVKDISHQEAKAITDRFMEKK